MKSSWQRVSKAMRSDDGSAGRRPFLSGPIRDEYGGPVEHVCLEDSLSTYVRFQKEMRLVFLEISVPWRDWYQNPMRQNSELTRSECEPAPRCVINAPQPQPKKSQQGSAFVEFTEIPFSRNYGTSFVRHCMVRRSIAREELMDEGNSLRPSEAVHMVKKQKEKLIDGIRVVSQYY
jgi:hypothetical protein